MMGTIYMRNIPSEAFQETKEFCENFKKKWERTSFTEQSVIEMNYELEEFQRSIEENYTCLQKPIVRLDGEIAFHRVDWNIEDICAAYKKEYPERYKDKREYTRMEVNNMLFDLELANVIGGYGAVASSWDLRDYNSEIFCGNVEVMCRY